jgi:1,4-dihydroxy-2-naphthoate octaprenyltransferase
MTSTTLNARTTVPGILGVSRAPFLPLAILLGLSGSLAQGVGALNISRMLLAVIGITAAHIMVNVLNEINDDVSGLDHETERTPFSGGSGALQAGLITRQGAWIVAIVSGLVTITVGAVALFSYGVWSLVPVIVGGAVCIVFYTPWLLRMGIGELAAGIGLGGLPVTGAALLQGEPLRPAVWLVALIATCMTFNLLLLNTIPDREPDAKVGRRSLVQRFGVRGVAFIGFASWLIATGTLVGGVLQGALSYWALCALLPAVAFALPYIGWLRAGASAPIPIPVLGANVIHNLGTHALLVLAWVIAGR